MSSSSYIEYSFKIEPLQPASDILIAQLGEIGFESFVEYEAGIFAYIQKDDWSEGLLNTVQILTNSKFKISSDFKEIEKENWNVKWESNFSPIQVDGQCVVRAPFHEKTQTNFDIVIEPKMSFGTGHHETTYMMLQFILGNDFSGKAVLDMGCGTGVLGILASMKGAERVDAIDVDNWCYQNAKENIERNKCMNISVLEGDSRLLKARKYDIILANINRNVLLKDIPVFSGSLAKNGMLFLSGFYREDMSIITKKCKEVRLKFEKSLEKNNWVAVKYVF